LIDLICACALLIHGFSLLVAWLLSVRCVMVPAEIMFECARSALLLVVRAVPDSYQQIALEPALYMEHFTCVYCPRLDDDGSDPDVGAILLPIQGDTGPKPPAAASAAVPPAHVFLALSVVDRIREVSAASPVIRSEAPVGELAVDGAAVAAEPVADAEAAAAPAAPAAPKAKGKAKSKSQATAKAKAKAKGKAKASAPIGPQVSDNKAPVGESAAAEPVADAEAAAPAAPAAPKAKGKAKSKSQATAKTKAKASAPIGPQVSDNEALVGESAGAALVPGAASAGLAPLPAAVVAALEPAVELAVAAPVPPAVEAEAAVEPGLGP